MDKSELRPLKIRRKGGLRGWWLLLALAAAFAAMIWTSSMNGQGPFALAIMAGLTGLGFLLGAYITARPPELLLNEKGVYVRNLGRSLDWENIHGISKEHETVSIGVREGDRTWRMPIDLSNLRLNPKSRQKLDTWLAVGHYGDKPIPNTSSSFEPFDEYVVRQSWAGPLGIAVLISLFVVFALLATAWAIPALGLLFSPIGLIFGLLISVLLPGARAAAVRANFHSLWVMSARSIPWSAVANIKLADARKNHIQIDLRGDRYEDGQGALESPVLIDISKAHDTGDEIVHALKYISGEETDEAPTRTEYRPNAYTKGDLLFSAATVLVLVLWGGWGVWVDDLVMPARRDALHLHGLSAWLMYAAWLLAAASFVAIVVDHYDKRNNEKRYKRIGQSAVFGAWLLFFGALTVNVAWQDPSQAPPCVTKVLKAVDSVDGTRTAYAYVFECRNGAAELVNVSVLSKGTRPVQGRPNVATIIWPGKFSDLRWEGEKLQVVHTYPWKLKPVKGSPVAIQALAR